jgi:hypothetical protein
MAGPVNHPLAERTNWSTMPPRAKVAAEPGDQVVLDEHAGGGVEGAGDQVLEPYRRGLQPRLLAELPIRSGDWAPGRQSFLG